MSFQISSWSQSFYRCGQSQLSTMTIARNFLPVCCSPHFSNRCSVVSSPATSSESAIFLHRLRSLTTPIISKRTTGKGPMVNNSVPFFNDAQTHLETATIALELSDRKYHDLFLSDSSFSQAIIYAEFSPACASFESPSLHHPQQQRLKNTCSLSHVTSLRRVSWTGFHCLKRTLLIKRCSNFFYCAQYKRNFPSSFPVSAFLT